MLGADQAMYAVISALIANHPDQEALSRSMDYQAQIALSFLTNHAFPEASVEMFHLTIERLRLGLREDLR